MFENFVLYNFGDVNLVAAIQTLKIINRNFVLSLENWLIGVNQ